MSGLFFYNGDQVKGEEIRASKDLLNPDGAARFRPTNRGRELARRTRQCSTWNSAQSLGNDYISTKSRSFLVNGVSTRIGWRGARIRSVSSCREDDVKSLRQEVFKLVEVFEMSDITPRVTVHRGSLPLLVSLRIRLSRRVFGENNCLKHFRTAPLDWRAKAHRFARGNG